jgi:Raf kinase inhibitor-like YbhB/YbcL family protein
MALTLASPAFATNGDIPKAHTCDGAGSAPRLEWSGAPVGTKSFALIVDDPDAPDPKAPKRTYVHWVAYDIPSSATHLVAEKGSPSGFREGVNDGKGRGYTGPCPPIGRHRYFFKLYALDVVLGDLGEPTKSDLETAMRGHVLEQAELVGTYERTRGAKMK